MNTANMPSQRQLRVGELVRKSLAQCLIRGDVRDDIIEHSVVSISEVKMSADLKLATIYVSPLGAQDVNAIVNSLANNAKFLRGRLGRALALKYTPDLRFQVDNSFDEYAKIDALLRSPEVTRDLKHQISHQDQDIKN